jgi:release factor glutamine methyltransferase
LTLREWVDNAVVELIRAGVESPRVDAALILSHAIARDRTYLIGHPSEALSESGAECANELLSRRMNRVPLPYLLSEWEFMGRRYEVGPEALIPRPETEGLVKQVLEYIGGKVSILDVGTGTGCIAIELAHQLPQARVTAIDSSPEAIQLARRNVERFGLADRVFLRHARFPDEIDGLGPFDAVVSNPPYIPSAEVDRLAPEQVRYEPRAALDGGADGLDVLRSLAADAPKHLKRGGILAVEIGFEQREQVWELLSDPNWEYVGGWPDLAGITRVVIAQLEGSRD